MLLMRPGREEIFDWVDEHVFNMGLYFGRKTGEIAADASKALSVELSEDDIERAISEVRRRKNYNLTKYPFEKMS